MRKKDRLRDRLPPCLPLSYQTFLRIRKVYRQTRTRIQERRLARQPLDPLLADGEVAGSWVDGASVPNPVAAINKCAYWMEDDLGRPDIQAITDQMVALKAQLTSRGLRFTNPAGNFLAREYHPNLERAKLWENAWVTRHTQPAPGHRVLDIGGASTIFSFYLASRGCRVAVVDNDWANCGTLYNARYVAARLDWQLEVFDRNVNQPLPFPARSFDRVYSICVLEHLPPAVRQHLMREVGRVLKPSGLAGFTCDYDTARPVLVTDRGLRFACRAKLERDVIAPSGLAIDGNADWLDACEGKIFLGAFFLHQDASKSVVHA